MRYFEKNNAIFQKLPSYLIMVSLGIVFLLHLFTIIYEPYLNHDVAAYLTAGQMLIGGARPYVDIIDTNFPMIIYINAIPAAFSYLTRVPLAVTGIVFFFCVIIGMMLLFGKILKLTFSELTREQIQFIYIIWLFCSLWTYQNNDFGQREQLIILFITPFLVLRHARYREVNIPLHLSIIITTIAFCGVAIKPLYIFPILIIEAIQVFVHRRFLKPFISVETLVFVILGIVYMTHFYFFPGMSSFYDYWLGFMLRGYIKGSSYSIGWKETIKDLLYNQSFIHGYFILNFILCLILLYDKSSLFLLSSYFGWFACCSLLLYIWQAKGFPYHLLPFYYSIFIGITLLFLAIKKLFVKIESSYVLLLAIASIFIMVISYPTPFSLLRATVGISPFLFHNNKLVKTIKSLTEPNDRVLFIDTSTHPGFPALTYTGRKLGGRFLTTFPLEMIFQNSLDYVPEKQWRDDEAKFYDSVVRDVNTLKPKLIFISAKHGLQTTAPYFNIPEYLKRKGFYMNISSSYRNIGLVKLVFKSYELWLYSENESVQK